MNLKDMIFIVGIALVTTWGFEYLFFSKKTDQCETVQAGQSFIAPKAAQELKPIETEVDFIDARRSVPTQVTEVETDLAHLYFSTDGGSLERLEFKRKFGGWRQALTTLFPPADTEREKRCFLVGLEEKTPYYYKLVGVQDLGTHVEVVYQADGDGSTIVKKYTVFKDSYKINLALTIKPGSTPVEARIFYPAPVMQDIAADDVKSSLVAETSGSITITARGKINSDMYWVTPTLFGADNRYFVNALVTDPDHFTQRAYYKLTGQNELYAILEGPKVNQETTWQLSFYCGPKESGPMGSVDPRLEQTMGYAGWFAPIARWLLALLNFLYDYLGNYGLAIIALTILTKLVLLPFSLKGNESLRKHGELQRKLKYLQQKYKDNPEQLALERADLMRKEGLGGLSGCLPQLLQLPIFFALSRVLSTSIELHQAPFYGWITDLSAKDPYYVLPLLVTVSILLQASTGDAGQRMQMMVMALVFGAITSTMAAGLCLYIFMSTLLSALQNFVQKTFKANGYVG
ncbi:MAG TPA: membrane protein insertase YidC [Candidatus Limnocylindria bacterium]|nr:membrane protein insertase YidC [Candidatus Limnocylindria bacterium]